MGKRSLTSLSVLILFLFLFSTRSYGSPDFRLLDEILDPYAYFLGVLFLAFLLVFPCLYGIAWLRKTRVHIATLNTIILAYLYFYATGTPHIYTPSLQGPLSPPQVLNLSRFSGGETVEDIEYFHADSQATQSIIDKFSLKKSEEVDPTTWHLLREMDQAFTLHPELFQLRQGRPEIYTYEGEQYHSVLFVFPNGDNRCFWDGRY